MFFPSFPSGYPLPWPVSPVKSRMFRRVAPAFLVILVLAVRPTNLPAVEAADKAWQAVEAAMHSLQNPELRPKNKAELTRHLQAAFVKYESAKARFLELAPTDPRRWQARMFELETGGSRIVAGLSAINSEAVLAEMLSGSDVPDDVRGEASGRRLLLDTAKLGTDRDFEQKWLAASETHLKTYPSAQATPEVEAQRTALQRLAGFRGMPLELKVTTLDGREFDLKQMRGKVVLIHVWATWCLPCILDLPDLKAAYAQLHGRGFEVISISFDKDLDRLRAFLKDEGLPWPQYCDGLSIRGQFAQRYQIEKAPTEWLVDKAGYLAGPVPKGGLVREVEKLLAR